MTTMQDALQKALDEYHRQRKKNGEATPQARMAVFDAMTDEQRKTANEHGLNAALNGTS